MGYPTAAVQEKRESTLNDCLNKIADSLQFQCERIESVLARVNGTPGTPTSGRLGGSDVAQIRPTHPMGQVVDTLEQLSQRLANLASGVESIA
jgi:hypothetical protein